MVYPAGASPRIFWTTFEPILLRRSQINLPRFTSNVNNNDASILKPYRELRVLLFLSQAHPALCRFVVVYYYQHLPPGEGCGWNWGAKSNRTEQNTRRKFLTSWERRQAPASSRLRVYQLLPASVRSDGALIFSHPLWSVATIHFTIRILNLGVQISGREEKMARAQKSIFLCYRGILIFPAVGVVLRHELASGFWPWWTPMSQFSVIFRAIFEFSIWKTQSKQARENERKHDDNNRENWISTWSIILRDSCLGGGGVAFERERRQT